MNYVIVYWYEWVKGLILRVKHFAVVEKEKYGDGEGQFDLVGFCGTELHILSTDQCSR